MANVNKVLYNVDQRPDLSAAEQKTARDNIGAVSATDLITEISRAQSAEAAATSEVVQGPGISVSSSVGGNDQTIYTVTNTWPSPVYKATMVNVNGVRTADYAAIVAAADAGKIVLLGGDDNEGTFVGKLKYYTDSYALFDGFYSQPMRMTEIFVNVDNSITTYTRHIYATTVDSVYQATRTDTRFYQNNIDKLEWTGLGSYLTTAGDAQWYSGADVTTPVTASDVLTAVSNIQNYQLLKVSVSGSICHTLESLPAGTPLGVIRLRFRAYARRISDQQYQYAEIAESPLVLVDCSDYAQNGNTVRSPWRNFWIDMTIDTARLSNLGFNAAYYDDSGLQLCAELLHYTPTGSIHDLGIKNMSWKYTLLEHV